MNGISLRRVWIRMSTQTYPKYDVVVVGAGMGGLTTASLLARDGYRVLVLEASHLPGGCSSSYPRKGYVFESGATTLIGFDTHQPLNRLESMLGITLPKEPIDPPMAVRMNGEIITRYANRKDWVKEAARVFGNPRGQERFWNKAFRVSDAVWRLSEKNTLFPPIELRDWGKLAMKNHISDLPIIRHAFRSVRKEMRACGVDSPGFRAFIDEQLLITAQSRSEETPFIFGAPALTYTNCQNYYVPGGMLKMVQTLQDYLEERGGQVRCKNQVTAISALSDGGYEIQTKTARYLSERVITNLPVWNLPDITGGAVKSWFEHQAAKFSHAWGAFVMGIAVDDHFPEGSALHQQIHLDVPMPHTGAHSLFVSLSQKGDTARAPEGQRVLNISCHTEPEPWFEKGDTYDHAKKETREAILDALESGLPGFRREYIKTQFEGTPVTWHNWLYRHLGRVGGIPQSMKRSLLDWPPAQTPFDDWYLTGDTVYPGQGIPGVTLSGINAYWRVVQKQTRTGIFH